MNQIRFTAILWFIIGVVVGKILQEASAGTYKEGQVDGLHGQWHYLLSTNTVEVVERIKE